MHSISFLRNHRQWHPLSFLFDIVIEIRIFFREIIAGVVVYTMVTRILVSLGGGVEVLMNAERALLD